jgi:hypothetical protein
LDFQDFRADLVSLSFFVKIKGGEPLKQLFQAEEIVEPHDGSKILNSSNLKGRGRERSIGDVSKIMGL